MRKKLRCKIAEMSKNKKEIDNLKFRENKRDEADHVEKLMFTSSRPKRQEELKSRIDKERTYKLLSRGIPSHFYKNLNKSQN